MMQALKILSGLFKGLTPLSLMVKVKSRTCEQLDAPSGLLPGKNPGTHLHKNWLGTRVGLHVFGDESISDRDSNSGPSSS
jgi:hypothetical protein